MASIFKNLTNSDIAQARTLLHEAIPITGTIVSGTYDDENIKNYSHQMFQSVYDYPYLSSSANHIFDLTYGYSSNLSGAFTQNQKKLNLYNEMSQILAGYDINGQIRKFDLDGDYVAGGTTLDDCVFVAYARLLTKDEIKKQTYTFELNNGKIIQDAGAATSYKINSPAGEYGLLYTNSAGTGDIVGHLYYQAGIAVLTSSLFTGGSDFTSSNITGTCDTVRSEWVDNDFNNTTELNSTIYFCRLNASEFNYSSNPTYLSSSKIVVKGNSKTNPPISYITTVGLYSADNELLAVAKLSEAVKKTDSNALTLRVRMDY